MGRDIIYDSAAELVKEYRTRDPIKIMEYEGIEHDFADMGELKGFFSVIDNEPFIAISSNISAQEQQLVCGHELGHHYHHFEIAREQCLKEFEIFNMRDVIENEANIFAAHLLIDERQLLAILKYGWTVFQVSQILRINVNLIYIKLAEMNKLGYHFDLSWGDRKLFG